MTSRTAGRSTAQPSAHPLARIRRRHGWSYQDLARVIAENARALGVPMAARREKVWRWEHWGVTPEPDSQRALARALGVPVGELRTHPWPGWLPARAGTPAGLPWTPRGALAAVQRLLDDPALDPRGYPLAEGEALRDAVAEWTAADRDVAAGQRPGENLPDPRGNGPAADDMADGSTDDAADDGRGIDERVLSWLESGALGLRQLGTRLGGEAVGYRAGADLRVVAGLLRRGPHEPLVQARLFRIAADLAQLGGWAAAESGRQGAAKRHYLTGLRLAHSAGDRALSAYLWAGMALQALIADRPEDALAAAEAAALAADGCPARVRAMAAASLARAHAALGEEYAARRGLSTAQRLLAAAGSDAGPAWLSGFGSAELAAIESDIESAVVTPSGR